MVTLLAVRQSWTSSANYTYVPNPLCWTTLCFISDSPSTRSIFNSLVICLSGSPATHEHVTIAFDRQRIFADIGPPHIYRSVNLESVNLAEGLTLNGTRAQAVHAFDLIFTNDGILQRCSIGEYEDSIGTDPFGIACARDASPIRLQAAIESACDGLGHAVCDTAFGCWNWKAESTFPEID